MPEFSKKPWYKKKRYIIPLAAAALIIIGANSNNPPSQSQPQAKSGQTVQIQKPAVAGASTLAPQSQQDVQPAPQVQDPAPVLQPQQPPAPSSLSNDNYYTNSQGDTIHSPAYNQPDNSVAPAGATAQCNDGTYSFSASRRGTCSHHGGVAQWLY